jgi:hypothetical protein
MLAGCTDDSSSGSPPSGIDAGFDASADRNVADATKPDGSSSDTGPNESGADVVVTDGATVDASDGGDRCPALDTTGTPLVGENNVTGAPPAMTGGTIAPGTYWQTNATAYFPTPTTATRAPTHTAAFITPTTFSVHTFVYAMDAGADAAPTSELFFGADLTSDGGAGISKIRVCGQGDAGAVFNEQYSVNGSTILFASPLIPNGTQVNEYTKQ